MKIRDVLESLTLEEKCALCAQSENRFGEIKKLGISGISPQDNPRGMADYFHQKSEEQREEGYYPVAFPTESCLAMSWDENLAYETGKNFALECRANPEMITWLFRPGMNLKRSVLCGRNFQYFSEDPVLTGEMAGSYIQGLQDYGVAATPKHFLCNHQEFERMSTNSIVSERALREVYLRAFEIAARKGEPLAIMSSYNKINGEWVNSNQHICDLLRKEIGYEGLVVSDAMAIHHNKVESHMCGMMDLELADASIHTQELIDAVKCGKIEEECINQSVERLLRMTNLLERTDPVCIDMEDMHESARISAEKCMVLLKNTGILPLKESQDHILVVGKIAEEPSYTGGGSGHMNGYRVENYLEEIRKIAPDTMYAPGYELAGTYPPVEPVNEELIQEALEKARQAELLLVFAGLGYGYESEGYDREDMKLPEGQRRLLDALIRQGKKLVLILSCGSVLDIHAWNDSVEAILYNGLGGEAVAAATVNVLFGKSEPGGRLAETWPVYEEHTSAFLNFAGMNKMHRDVIYGEDIYVGYRWYQKRVLPVLYPFGYGLSYTDFQIGAPVLSCRTLCLGEEIKMKVFVKNRGERAGSQVLQVYFGKQGNTVVERPEKQLIAFAKVWLEPGESKIVEMKIQADALRYYDTVQDRWVLEGGEYCLMVGTSCEQIHHMEKIQIEQGEKEIVYTEMTPLVWFTGKEKFYQILMEHFSPEVAAMLNPKMVPMMALAYAVPIYRFTEPIFGMPLFDQNGLELILEKMNE